MMVIGAGEEPLKLSHIILLGIAIGVASFGYTEGKHRAGSIFLIGKVWSISIS